MREVVTTACCALGAVIPANLGLICLLGAQVEESVQACDHKLGVRVVGHELGQRRCPFELCYDSLLLCALARLGQGSSAVPVIARK